VVFACALLFAVLGTGCLAHRYGDATLQERTDLVSITPDRLSLKPVPLDRAATYTLRVRDLPFAIYPTHLRVPLTPTEAELKSNAPWERTKLRVELRAPDGRTFFSNEVALVEAERGRSPGTYHQLIFQLRQPDARPWRAPANLPHFTSYDAVVTVLAPSRNPSQRAILYAETYVR